MPQPTAQSVHLDAILTNISVAYIQSGMDFISTKAFPVVPVEKQTDKYYVYRKNDWFRDEAKRRADATESAGSGYNMDRDAYSCDVFAFHKDVGDQARKNADSPLDLDRDASMFVTQRLLLRQEKQWADDCFKTGVWATDVTGVAAAPGAGQFIQWSDYASSDPIKDLSDGKRKVLSTTGFKPNTLILGYDTFAALENHPDLIDRIKYSGEKVVTESLMAMLFGVSRILVAQSVIATNKEGETSAMSFVHGKGALLSYVNPSPSLLAPSAGYTFAWRGVSGGLGQNVGISRFRMDKLKADRIEGEAAFDNKIVAADLGYFFTTAVA